MWHTGNIYLITAIAVIGGGLFGFDISSMSAIISTQPYLCYFNQGPDGPGFNDSPLCSGPKSNTQGGITASMAGGSWLGALISGYLTDRVGRKRAIQIGSVFWYETRPLFFSSRWRFKVSRLNSCLCLARHWNAHCRPYHQRSCSWCKFSNSPHL